VYEYGIFKSLVLVSESYQVIRTRNVSSRNEHNYNYWWIYSCYEVKESHFI